jgi:hypothetical protein
VKSSENVDMTTKIEARIQLRIHAPFGMPFADPVPQN